MKEAPSATHVRVQQMSLTDFVPAANEKNEDGGSMDVIYLRIMLLNAISPLWAFTREQFLQSPPVMVIWGESTIACQVPVELRISHL